MQLMTNFLAGELLPPTSLSVNPRDRASETHRLKLSLSDSLASARDALAASVVFFCATATLDVTTVTASTVAVATRIWRTAFIRWGTLSDATLVATVREFHYTRGHLRYPNVVAKSILA